MQCLDNLERLSQFSSRELQDALEADVEEWKKQPRQAAQVWRQLAQRKQIPKSLQILRFLQQHGVEAADAITFNIAIAASSKVSTWQSACEFLELMKECRVQATTVTCNTVLNVYERASKWHLALQLPEEIKAVAMGPDGIMMNACTSNVARMRKWQHAMLMLEEVSDDYENIAFNSALSSMETSMWFAGQDFLQRMHSSKIQADRYTYSTLLKISPWRHALLGMAQAEVDCDDRDAVITGALLAACESSWYVSLHILREAQASRAADNVAFNSGINAAEKSTWECALLLLGTMRASEVRTDSYSFSSAMGPWKLSVRLLSQMQEDGASPNLVCLNSVANALERSGDWKAALELLKRNLFHPDTTTFNILLNACGRASAWQMAIEILKLAQKNMAHDAITFRSAISACEGGNCWKEAIKLLTDMQRQHLLPEVAGYNAAISACEKKSLWEIAFALSSQGRQQAVLPDVVSFNALLAACGAMWPNAQCLLSDLRMKFLKPDAITYNSALRARGPWRDAQFFLDELARNGLALALPLAWLFLLVTPAKSGGFGVSSSEDIIACNTVLEVDRIGLKWHAVCLLLEKMNIAALCLQWSVPCAQVSCLKSFNVVRHSACHHGVLA